MAVFCKHDISYILKTTNTNSIAHLVWDNNVTPSLLTELEELYQVVTVKPSAIVCTIGSNIGIPSVLAKACAGLGGCAGQRELRVANPAEGEYAVCD